MSCLNDGRHKGEYLPKGRKEMKNMKKNIFKKIVASLATVAMAAGLFTAMPTEETKAAADDYIILGDSVGSSWDATAATSMTHDGNGVYSYSFSATVGNVYEFKIGEKGFQVEDKDWKTVIGGRGDKNWGNIAYKATDANVTIKYDSKIGHRAGITVTGATLAEPITTETMNFVGDKRLAAGHDWAKDKNQMTLVGDAYVIEFEDVEPGTYAYKILENAATLEWNSFYISGKLNKDGNGELVVSEKSDVKVSINKDTKVITFTLTPVQAPTQSTENSTQSTENSTQATENSTQATQATTKKEEATTAKKVDSVTVTVEWKDAPKGDVNIHAWGAASTAWPGQKMTANGDGTYTTTLKLTSEGKISFVVNVDGDANKTKDITDVDTSTGKIVIKVSKDAEGKLVGTANAVTTGNVSGGTGSAKPGDSAPIVMMFAVAAVAAGMVVASKKKTICE